MKYFITNFYNLRYLKENYIPISTCANDPKYFHNKENKWCYNQGYYINDNNVLFGIREESLSPLTLEKEDITCINCDRSAAPNCRFLQAYEKYILSIDFDKLLLEFNRIAEETRKITNYIGEPNIVLLVYEPVSSPCSERYGLKKLFAMHNIELIEFSKN